MQKGPKLTKKSKRPLNFFQMKKTTKSKFNKKPYKMWIKTKE